MGDEMAVCIDGGHAAGLDDVDVAVRQEELTKRFVFVLGLRKYSGAYALPPGLGFCGAVVSELIVILLLLLDRGKNCFQD